MKPNHVIVLIATALITGSSGLLIGSLMGRTAWAAGDSIKMGICFHLDR